MQISAKSQNSVKVNSFLEILDFNHLVISISNQKYLIFAKKCKFL